MPGRDYYLKDDERFAEYREAYATLVARLLKLAGFEGAGEKAGAIIELETRLAEV